MTLLGKSFTFAILILSAVFMMLSLAVNATHRNWRDVVIGGVDGQPGLKKQIETIGRENSALRDSEDRIRKELTRERAARASALAALQSQLNQLQADLVASENEAADQRGKNAILAQTDRTRAEQLEQLTNENVKLRESVRREQQERDELFTQTVELTDQRNRLRGFLQQYEERNQQLTAQVTRFQEVVTSKGIDVNESLDGAPPDRNGRVIEINRPRSLVLVSIGFDEGLRAGHFLEVTRDGRYVGKLKVVRAGDDTPDRAVAEILKDYSEGIVQEGDRVDTTLD